VKTTTFICYRPIQGILERLGSENVAEIKAVFQEATDIRDARVDGRHFFEIALSLAVSKGVGEQVIGEMLKEPAPGTRIRGPIDIDRSSLPERLKRESAVKTRGDVFAIASKCSLIDGTEVHIPMVDFRITPNPESEQAVVTAMRSISPSGGAVMQSKNSYHFYGTSITRPAWLVRFSRKELVVSGAHRRPLHRTSFARGLRRSPHQPRTFSR
jgi:hypothetical protein